MDKKTLRKALLQIRVARSWGQEQQKITEHLKAYFLTHPTRTVGLYWPIRKEIDLRGVMQSLQREGVVERLALPRLNGKTMSYLPWTQKSVLTENAMGLIEPAFGEELVPDCLLVPCVAMDRLGRRLGYGGGYFDRYLEKYANIMTVGVLASVFLQESIPLESHDRGLDASVTENGWQNYKK